MPAPRDGRAQRSEATRRKLLDAGARLFSAQGYEGTSLDATDRVVKRMESTIGARDGVERHYASVGSRLVSGGLSLTMKRTSPFGCAPDPDRTTSSPKSPS